MLVLSRRSGEQICISGSIEITVLKVRGGRVRLGLSAPDNVRIRRSELIPEDPIHTEADCTRERESAFLPGSC